MLQREARHGKLTVCMVRASAKLQNACGPQLSSAEHGQVHCIANAAVLPSSSRNVAATQANQRRVARVSKEIERNIGNLFLYDKARPLACRHHVLQASPW